jgi:hypothetical protein
VSSIDQEKRKVRRILVRLAFFVAAMGAPVTAHAYRPFDGTDADVAKPGEFELEMGPGYMAGPAMPPTFALPTMVLNQGMGHGFEFVVDGTNQMPLHRAGGEPVASLVDTDVQLKWLFHEGSLQGRSGLSAATEFGPLLPTSEQGHYGADANVIVSQRWSALTLHLNNGYVRTRDAKNEIVSSLIFETLARHAVHPVAEVLFRHEMEVGSDTVYSVLVGGIWRTSDSLVFDFGAREELVDRNPATEVRIGLTWTLPIWTTATTSETEQSACNEVKGHGVIR